MIRWGRLISTFLVFLILIWKHRSEKLLLSAILLLLMSDVLLLNYENMYINTATFPLRIAAYSTIVLVIFPEIKTLKMSIIQKVVFAIVFSLNIAMLYVLVDMIPEKYDYPHLNFLFYIYGSAAISYSNIYSDATAFFFTAGALCLVFSDIMSFIAYYLEFYEFYYPDRFFYILGIISLVKFATFSRNHEPLFEMERL